MDKEVARQLNTLKCEYYDMESYKAKSKPEELSLFSLNIRSVHRNIGMFVIEFQRHNHDIISLSETRLTKDIEPMYTISSYDSFFNSHNTKGGGILMYIKSFLKFN